MAVQAITEYELSEVLIGGHDQSFRLFGLMEPDSILLPWGGFCGVENVMSPLPQPLDDGARHVLVGEELHVNEPVIGKCSRPSPRQLPRIAWPPECVRVSAWGSF